MGSALRLTYGRGRIAERARRHRWELVVAEFEAAEAAMSRFRATSELTLLNRTAGSGAVAILSDRLRRALAAADRARRLTDDRFDPRVLHDLDRLGYRGADLDGPGGAGRASAPVSSSPAAPGARRHGLRPPSADRSPTRSTSGGSARA